MEKSAGDPLYLFIHKTPRAPPCTPKHARSLSSMSGKRRRAVPSRLLEGADPGLSSSSSSEDEDEGGGAAAAAAPRARASPAAKKRAPTTQHMYVYRYLTTRDITKDLEGETVREEEGGEREGARNCGAGAQAAGHWPSKTLSAHVPSLDLCPLARRWHLVRGCCRQGEF